MSNAQFDQHIRDHINSFVEQLSALVRKAAVEAVRTALTGDAPAAASVRRGPGRPRKNAAAPAAAPAKKAGKRKRAKVSPAALAAAGAKVMEYLTKRPGQSLEQIGKGLNTPTANLKLPIKALLGGKKLKTTGQRRGTKYSVK
ncbi:MAG: DNA-binding protein [Planctomycetes bacterium]|nr:DNA-binding protein [Planctomycetota bacterium]